jgi:phosphoribosyl 1,2-cyclic phosphate phosphodiesterase
MIITFLGTSGANAFPEAFCKCPNCEQSRKLGGSSLRKRSALLINDDLLIDLGPDIMSSSQILDLDLTNVSCCIQTHPHADHLDLSHLLSRSPDHGVVGAPCLNFFASQETLQFAAQDFIQNFSTADFLAPDTQKFMNLKLHTVNPFISFEYGGYHITPFPANHALKLGAMVYAVEKNNKRIFYGTDTGVFFEETWQAFHRFNLHFDLVILDHTYGLTKSGSDHLNAFQVIEHAERMQSEGLLTPTARIFATHIAHEGNPPYPELSGFARQHGYEIAYDGLRLEV